MTVHGTARWAEREELYAKGYLPEFNRAPAGQLLVGFWNDFTAIRYSGDLHQLIVGGTGGGKFTTALAPMLLSGMEHATLVAVDPKGEMAKLAGPYFQAPFAEKPSVFLLDPWDVCETGRSHALNVLDEITADNPNSVDDARALADAIIIPSGAENTHWDNAARNIMTAVILYVALDPAESAKRDLVRVREIVTLPWQMPKAYVGAKQPTLMELLVNNLQSTVAGGAIKRGFSSLLNREEKERSGILSSVERDTAWIDSPQMEKVLKSDPQLALKAVGDGQNKYFIVLPPEYFMTHRAWLRLMVTAFAKAMKRYQPTSYAGPFPSWRHIIIDEFANLGEMSFILNEVAIARGYGVKYHFAIQDLSQLKRVYKDGWESFINNSFQRFFAIGDLFTADYVSRMLGSATVFSLGSSSSSSETDSTSVSHGQSMNRGSNFPGAPSAFANHSAGFGKNSNQGESLSRGMSVTHSSTQVQRPLMTPDEVRRIHEGMQIVFFRGLHPVLCLRLPYWTVFPSLPPFTLKEVLSTVGHQPSPNEIAHFTNWRMDARMLQPRRRAITWRMPRGLPELSGYLLKAAVFLLVAGGLFYGLFELVFPRPPQQTALGTPAQKTPMAQAQPLPVPPLSDAQRAKAKYEVDLQAVALTLEGRFTQQVRNYAAALPNLRSNGSCDSPCWEPKNPLRLHNKLWDTDDKILGALSARRSPLSVTGDMDYKILLAENDYAFLSIDLAWRISTNSSVREQLSVQINGPKLTATWQVVVLGIAKTVWREVPRETISERIGRACATQVVEQQGDDAVLCYRQGAYIRIWRQAVRPDNLGIDMPPEPEGGYQRYVARD